jgi:hypothetical protein
VIGVPGQRSPGGAVGGKCNLIVLDAEQRSFGIFETSHRAATARSASKQPNACRTAIYEFAKRIVKQSAPSAASRFAGSPVPGIEFHDILGVTAADAKDLI